MTSGVSTTGTLRNWQHGLPRECLRLHVRKNWEELCSTACKKEFCSALSFGDDFPKCNDILVFPKFYMIFHFLANQEKCGKQEIKPGDPKSEYFLSSLLSIKNGFNPERSKQIPEKCAQAISKLFHDNLNIITSSKKNCELNVLRSFVISRFLDEKLLLSDTCTKDVQDARTTLTSWGNKDPRNDNWWRQSTVSLYKNAT